MWPDEVDLGGGVVLRAPDPIDAASMVSAINDSLPDLGRWMAWAQSPAVVDQQAVRLAIASEGFALGGDAAYSVADESGVIGSVGLHSRRGPGVYEVGYWLRTDRQGRGIIGRAVAAVVEPGFTVGGADILEIRCDEDNVRSAAVAARAGFRLRDTFDDPERPPPTTSGRTMVWELRRPVS